MCYTFVYVGQMWKDVVSLLHLSLCWTGVEDNVNETGVEENIGVVTFGGTSDVVQNLTNDFSRVRDAVGQYSDRFIFLILVEDIL